MSFTITIGCRSFHNVWASLAIDALNRPLESLWSTKMNPRGICIHKSRFKAPTGVFLHKN